MSHIQSAVKRSQQRVAVKKLEEEMSETQKDKEENYPTRPARGHLQAHGRTER